MKTDTKDSRIIPFNNLKYAILRIQKILDFNFLFLFYVLLKNCCITFPTDICHFTFNLKLHQQFWGTKAVQAGRIGQKTEVVCNNCLRANLYIFWVAKWGGGMINVIFFLVFSLP